jgi:hypothetical protein
VGGICLTERNEKKLSKVVIGGVLSLDKSLLYGCFTYPLVLPILLGDALLVYFGWPQAQEDDAQRAVRTALRMLEAMGTLNGVWAGKLNFNDRREVYHERNDFASSG